MEMIVPIKFLTVYEEVNPDDLDSDRSFVES